MASIGFERVPGVNDYFLIGTCWSFRDRIYVHSGSERSYAQKESMILAEEWVFYCLFCGAIFHI